MKKEDTKILNFKSKEKQNVVLSDKDINSLFLGLVKIVKKSCMNEVQSEFSSEIAAANTSFLVAENDFLQSQKRIEELEKENKILQDNLLELKLKLADMLSRDFTRN